MKHSITYELSKFKVLFYPRSASNDGTCGTMTCLVYKQPSVC